LIHPSDFSCTYFICPVFF